MTKRIWTSVAMAASAIGVLVVSMAACNSANTESDAGADAGGCTPGAKECVSPSQARVCAADGSRWESVNCGGGQVCAEGACQADPGTSVCSGGSGACVDAKTALRCRANLAGYESIACPEGTTCQGQGVCVGTCIVGSTICSGDGSVATCTDGKGYKATACGAAEACVVTSTPGAAIPTAACKPAECTPSSCGAKCGNAQTPTADRTKFVSRCVATPEGYKWSVTSCEGATSCRPGASTCSNTAQEAGCAADCAPGEERCSPDGYGIQTCTDQGKWSSTVTACNPSATTTPLVCMAKPGAPKKAVCGDAICAVATGVCDGNKLRRCDENGRLGASEACATGVCKATATSVSGFTPGRCEAECEAGDEKCAGTQAYLTCENGRWSTPKGCPGADAGVACANVTTAVGRPGKVCNAECMPGYAQCQTGDGGGSTAIRRCSPEGKWLPAEECAIGSCQSNDALGAACVAECIPGELVCTGGTASAGIASHPGTTGFGTCTAQGRFPTTTTTCGAGTSCRKDKTGRTLVAGDTACLECVGPKIDRGNEEGMVDTRCQAIAVDAGGGSGVQVCGDNNTWGPTSTCNGSSCSEATTRSGPAYPTCEFKRGHYVTASYYASKANGPLKCNGPKMYGSKDKGEPVECGLTPDCCSKSCTRPTPAAPARCN